MAKRPRLMNKTLFDLTVKDVVKLYFGITVFKSVARISTPYLDQLTKYIEKKTEESKARIESQKKHLL